MGKLIVGALVVMAASLGIWMSCECDKKPPPQLDPEEWWGPNDLKNKQDKSIRPFTIKFPDELVKDLRERLKRHRPFTPALEGVGFEYGFNSGQLDSWVTYWGDQYNFTEREKFLNQFPQFKTNIQGLDIHFIRVKPQVPAHVEVVPLLLMHGWPGSVREFYEAIPFLTKERPGYNFAFEVIIPSLPGFGFSDAAVRPGLGAVQIGMVFRNLMHRLNFKKFYVQGGDWGAFIASAMVTIFPEEILGHHTNMAFVQTGFTFFKTLIGSYFPSLVVDTHLADRLYPLSKLFWEFGYFHIQATKPDTVGVGLTDSPIGLLAYILEKFSTGTDFSFRSLPDGGLGTLITKDQLIDNLMFYWTSSCITTSMRIYAENNSKKNRALNINLIPSAVPTWTLQAKNDFYQPHSLLKYKYTNIVGGTVLEGGGHFLALELPDTFSQDVFKAVKVFRELQKTESKTEL